MDQSVKKVTILGCYNALATTIFGPMDILNQAGRLWNRLRQAPPTPYFDVTIASADGQPVRCTNNVLIQPHCSIETIDQTDFVVISSATYVEAAKRLLEEGSRPFNEITDMVGYEDISFFRKVFVRLTGLRPREYQQRFSPYAVKHILQ